MARQSRQAQRQEELDEFLADGIVARLACLNESRAGPTSSRHGSSTRTAASTSSLALARRGLSTWPNDGRVSLLDRLEPGAPYRQGPVTGQALSSSKSRTSAADGSRSPTKCRPLPRRKRPELPRCRPQRAALALFRQADKDLLLAGHRLGSSSYKHTEWGRRRPFAIRS